MSDTVQIPPQDAEAERMVLTSMVLRVQHKNLAIERLVDDDFYFENYRLYFQAIKYMERHNITPDMVTLRNIMAERGVYERAGGDVTLTEIITGYSAHNINGIIEVIITLAKRRKAIALANTLLERSTSPEANINELLLESSRQLMELQTDRNTGIKSMKELCDISVDDLKAQGVNMLTQYKDLNYLDALRQGTFVILAARTSKGKTAFALNLAFHAARSGPVLFFSLEMGAEALRNRVISMIAGINDQRIRRGECSYGELQELHKALRSAASLDMEIVDTKRYIHEICAIVRRKNQERPLELVVVDYIQKVKSTSSNMQRYQQLGEISGEFQGLVRDTNIRLICCAQLSRAADNREPELVDLRESGDLEQDADVVAFLHPKDEQLTSTIVWTDLMIKKHRNGPLGTIELKFEKTYTRFMTA